MKKKRIKTRKKRSSNLSFFLIMFIILFILVAAFIISNNAFPLKRLVGAAQTQQQGSFDLITPTPTITTIPQPTLPPGTPIPGIPTTPGPLPTGGAASPTDPFYCIDDEDPDGCDDTTAFHVPKGVGGPSGQCGTIMENAHKIVASLPQFLKGMRDSLNPAVKNTCYDTGTYSTGYLSTYFVIDAFRLTGFPELSKTNPSHVNGSSLLTWWQSQPTGYVYIPYTLNPPPSVLQKHASGEQNLTGCVVFINMPSGGVHVGIVNALQLVNGNGDGVLSILQSGARYFIDRFPVVGWDVKNIPLHQTNISGVAGFGCHT